MTMPKPSDSERRPPPTALAPMGACIFCQRPVELEALSAMRHLAFVCPKAPVQVREAALAEDGVVPAPSQRGGSHADGSPAAGIRARRGARR